MARTVLFLANGRLEACDRLTTCVFFLVWVLAVVLVWVGRVVRARGATFVVLRADTGAAAALDRVVVTAAARLARVGVAPAGAADSVRELAAKAASTHTTELRRLTPRNIVSV